IFRHDDEAFHVQFNRAKPYQAGLYRIRISLWSFQWDKGQVLPLKQPGAGSLVVNGRLLGYFDAPSLKSQVHEVVAWLNPGEVINFNAASLGRGGVAQTNGRAAGYAGPGIAMDWFEVEGPLAERWPPESHRRLFGDLPLAQVGPDAKFPPPRRLPLPRGIPVLRQLKKKEKQPTVWTVQSTRPETDAQRLLADFLPRA